VPEAKPDWQKLVTAHLARLALPAARKLDICRELAAHLEESYATLCTQYPEEEARRRTVWLLHQPVALQRGIQEAEKEAVMNQRTRVLWLPGLTTLALYTLLVTGLVRFGQSILLQPKILFRIGVTMLIVLGAIGAAWARAAGATLGQRIVVALAPLVMGLSALLIALPVHALRTGRPLFESFESGLLVALLLQAGALLLGAAPFLRSARSDHVPAAH